MKCVGLSKIWASLLSILIYTAYLSTVDWGKVPESFNGGPGPVLLVLEFMVLLLPRKIWSGSAPACCGLVAFKASYPPSLHTALSFVPVLSLDSSASEPPEADGGVWKITEQEICGGPLEDGCGLNYLSLQEGLPPSRVFLLCMPRRLISALIIIILA